MFEYIRVDMMRVFPVGRSFCLTGALLSLWEEYGLQALIIYRFGRWLNYVRKHRYGWAISFPLYPIYWVLSVYVRKAYDINLEQSADIAPGFYIAHFGGVEVRNCHIGTCCSIHQQVKLGSDKATAKELLIGDGVYIAAHAQIYANISIGDGVAIGAGAVVTQNISHHCLVLGNPGRIVQRDYNNRSLL
jgi:serine O-acetyltransferase